MTARAGLAPETIRLLSVGFASLAAAGVVIVGRQVVPRPAALFAGVFVAASSQFRTHAGELRAYSFYTLLTVALAWVLLRYVERPSRARAAAVAGVVCAGSLTHYFFFFFVGCAVVWLVLTVDSSERLRALLPIAFGLVPFVCWAPAFLTQVARGRFAWIGAFDVGTVRDTYRSLLFSASVGEPVGRVLISIAAALLVLAGAMLLIRAGGSAGWLVALFAVAPVLMAAALWLAGARIYAVRNLLGAAPFAAIAVAAVVTRLGRAAGAFVAVALAAGMLLHGTGAPSRPPYDLMAQALVDQGWDASHPIVVFDGFFDLRSTMRWYLPAGRALTLGTPAARRCSQLFVVTSASHAGRVADLPFEQRHWSGDSGGWFVGRAVHANPALFVRRGGRLLVSAERPASCVSVVSEADLDRYLRNRALRDG